MTTTLPADAQDTTQNAPDEARVEAFVGQFLTDLAGAANVPLILMGDRLGLYRAMTGAGPITADALATATGTNLRLITEWLASQTVAGYVEYDPAAGTYALPVEHAAVLSIAESPVYLPGAADIIASQFLHLGRLERAFRGDGGVDYAEHDASLFHGIERFFRTAYQHQLADVWFPAVDGLAEKLAAGAQVADIGCGHGAATLLMAQRWPASRFTGIDVHAPSITVARAQAIETPGVTNVRFETGGAESFGSGPYDVICYFDALHDLGDPPAALRNAYANLADGGYLIAVEPWSLDRLEDGIGHPLVRIAYSNSTTLCTPGSLSQPGRYGLGTQGGPARRIALLADAGFANPVLAADTGTNLVFAARK